MKPFASFAHFCRDDHPEIGHNDSEHEQCPLCRALAACASKDQRIAELEAQGHEQFREQNECIARLREEIEIAKGYIMAQQQRIAILKGLLEKVPHHLLDSGSWVRSKIPASKCFENCPRCAWEALKAEGKG